METLVLDKAHIGVSSHTSTLSGFAKILLFSAASILIGVLWDISWHMGIGRDTLFSPPHLAIYLGGIIAGVSSIYKTIQISFFGTTEEKSRSIRFWGLHAPFGAMFCIWGSAAMLTSAPFDDWWHNAYGLDVKILSPPHALLALGFFSIQLGSMFTLLALQNQYPESKFWNYAYYLSSGIFLSLVYIFVIEYMSRSRMHSPLFYQVAGGALPLVLLAGSRGVRSKYPATVAALFYMAFMILSLWIFPLIPAEPKLSPVRNPVDHLVPLPFPLLLCFPALAIDLINNRMRHLNFWPRVLLNALAFVSVLFAVQYFFAEFLISPASRNWVFGAHEWAYYQDPNAPYRYSFRPFEGTALEFAGGMFFAYLLTILSSSLGLTWGKWMQNIRR